MLYDTERRAMSMRETRVSLFLKVCHKMKW